MDCQAILDVMSTRNWLGVDSMMPLKKGLDISRDGRGIKAIRLDRKIAAEFFQIEPEINFESVSHPGFIRLILSVRRGQSLGYCVGKY